MRMNENIRSAQSDEAARALAAWLAPYLAEELGLEPKQSAIRPARTAEDGDEIDSLYDGATARRFVETLGDSVLGNARLFFDGLATDGQIGSLALAERLGVGSPRNIPSVLTTPLKRRAKALGLPYPWLEAADESDRTVWIGAGGVPGRFLIALRDETNRRKR